MRAASTIVIGVMCCLGCSSKAPYTERASARPEIFEVVGVEEQAKSAVAQSPTEFGVRIEDDAAAWSRARYFLSHYTDSGVRIDEAIPGGGRRLSNYQRPATAPSREQPTKNSDRYEYLVLKRPQGDMYVYRVVCRPRAAIPAKAHCQDNARNVARFISEGNLELSLLKQ